MKKTIFLTCFGILLLIGDVQYFRVANGGFRDFMRVKTGLKCGTVIDDFSEVRKVKHGVTTDYYLKISYPEGTVVEKVSGETWYDSKAGKYICFTVYEGINLLLLMSIGITCFLILIGITFGLTVFICWVFDIK